MRVCLPLALLASLTPLGRADDPPKAKDDKTRELHVVGIYEGYTKTDGQLHGAKAPVLVNRPGKTVTLVLVSYSPVTWEIALTKNTTVEKVILGGYSKSAVKGLPEKTEVVEAFRGSKDAKLPFHAYKTDDPRFPALVEAVTTLTGRKIASFQGLYRAEADSGLAVEDVSNDERLSPDYPTPAADLKLPKVTFQAHREVPGPNRFDVTRSFGEFTLSGPKADTLTPLPAGVSRITYDPTDKKCYGIYRHKLAEIDLDKKKAKEIDTGLDVPEISWPADVTFDAKLNRVLLVTSHVKSVLYAYTPKTGKWEALTETAPQVIVYHPKDAKVYGLKRDLGERMAPELQEINAKGAVVTSVPLEGAFLPWMFTLGSGTGGVQLAAADDKLVMLVSPVGLRGDEGSAPKWSYMYLLDQKTGKAQLVWKDKAK